MEGGPPSRSHRVVPRGQLLHYELWRTPGKLGAPMPFNSNQQDGAALSPRPPAQPLNCSHRMEYLRSKEAERARQRRLAGENPPRATRRRTGLHVDVVRLDPNGSPAHACDEFLTLLSPASTVFSVLSEAQSNGRVDVRLLGRRAAGHALR